MVGEMPANGGFSNSVDGLQAPDLTGFGAKTPKVSGYLPEYSRFRETAAGDWFDHDCRPRTAVDFAQWR
jgi:hypothetical protein